ncbi:hypothetical protein D9M68_454200 [compost metagenome]
MPSKIWGRWSASCSYVSRSASVRMSSADTARIHRSVRAVRRCWRKAAKPRSGAGCRSGMIRLGRQMGNEGWPGRIAARPERRRHDLIIRQTGPLERDSRDARPIYTVSSSDSPWNLVTPSNSAPARIRPGVPTSNPDMCSGVSSWSSVRYRHLLACVVSGQSHSWVTARPLRAWP